MIFVEKLGYTFSKKRVKLLKNSRSSKLWLKNKVVSTSKYYDLIEVVNSILMSFLTFTDVMELRSSLPHGTHQEKMVSQRGRIEP